MASQTAPRDPNQIPGLLATSNTDGTTVAVYANPTTHRLLVDSGSSASTATTWGSTGNTSTITDATITASSSIFFMCATPSVGRWGVVCGAGTATITSSDPEVGTFAFTYKVFP